MRLATSPGLPIVGSPPAVSSRPVDGRPPDDVDQAGQTLHRHPASQPAFKSGDGRLVHLSHAAELSLAQSPRRACTSEISPEPLQQRCRASRSGGLFAPRRRSGLHAASLPEGDAPTLTAGSSGPGRRGPSCVGLFRGTIIAGPPVFSRADAASLFGIDPCALKAYASGLGRGRCTESHQARGRTRGADRAAGRGCATAPLSAATRRPARDGSRTTGRIEDNGTDRGHRSRTPLDAC